MINVKNIVGLSVYIVFSMSIRLSALTLPASVHCPFPPFGIRSTQRLLRSCDVVWYDTMSTRDRIDQWHHDQPLTTNPDATAAYAINKYVFCFSQNFVHGFFMRFLTGVYRASLHYYDRAVHNSMQVSASDAVASYVYVGWAYDDQQCCKGSITSGIMLPTGRNQYPPETHAQSATGYVPILANLSYNFCKYAAFVVHGNIFLPVSLGAPAPASPDTCPFSLFMPPAALSAPVLTRYFVGLQSVEPFYNCIFTGLLAGEYEFVDRRPLSNSINWQRTSLQLVAHWKHPGFDADEHQTMHVSAYASLYLYGKNIIKNSSLGLLLSYDFV
jgi:hypothetical protein